MGSGLRERWRAHLSPFRLVRSLVVLLNEPSRSAVPAGLMAQVRPALARPISAIDFAGRREHEERAAVEVHVWVLFELLLGFGNRHLPSAGA